MRGAVGARRSRRSGRRALQPARTAVLGLARGCGRSPARSASCAAAGVEGAVDLRRRSSPMYSRIASNSALSTPATLELQHLGLARRPRRGCCRGCRSRVFRLITRVSRKQSIGGLVTWLKFWRKKWLSRPRSLSRQHRERRVVAHRADGFLAVLDHRVRGSAPGPRASGRRRPGGGAARRGRSCAARPAAADQLVEIDDVARSSRRSGCAPASMSLISRVVVELPSSRSTAIIWPGPSAALLDDRRSRRRGTMPALGADDQQAVGGAARSAAGAGRCGPCRRRPSGRRSWRARPGRPTAPSRVAVAVHGAVRLAASSPFVRPGLGDQHQLGHRRVAAGAAPAPRTRCRARRCRSRPAG